MTNLICIDVLGMGGWRLDPALGQLQIVRRLHAEGVDVVPPFDPADDNGPVVELRRLLAAGALKNAALMYVGDSCGANRFSWLQASVPEVHWRYAALIQPSLYCNANCPPIGSTVKEVDCFYTSFLTWPLPGLGSFKPQPFIAPRGGVVVPGVNVCNNGLTTINYMDQKLHVHPGDDDSGTQSIILKKGQQIMAES